MDVETTMISLIFPRFFLHPYNDFQTSELPQIKPWGQAASGNMLEALWIYPQVIYREKHLHQTYWKLVYEWMCMWHIYSNPHSCPQQTLARHSEIFSPFDISRWLFKSLLVLYPSGSQDQLVRVGMNVQSIQHPYS